MSRPRVDTVQVTFRIPRAWLAEADAIAKQMTKARHGVPSSRTEAFRAAMAVGLAKSKEWAP